jgi:hypothetical protein
MKHTTKEVLFATALPKRYREGPEASKELHIQEASTA